MTYNYIESMKEDILESMEYDYDIDVLRQHVEDDDIEEWLDDEMFVSGITGNDSGSYFCNSYKAEEALCHNWDLLHEACNEFGMSVPEDAEGADVTIRCYLLGQAIHEAVKEFDFDSEE